MSTERFPKIDYEKCTACLKCFSFCPHSVYEVKTDGKPFVAKPENCVPNCRGCEKVCPVGAINH